MVWKILPVFNFGLPAGSRQLSTPMSAAVRRIQRTSLVTAAAARGLRGLVPPNARGPHELVGVAFNSLALLTGLYRNSAESDEAELVTSDVGHHRPDRDRRAGSRS